MPARKLKLLADTDELHTALGALRRELDVPGEFAPEAVAEAANAAAAVTLPGLDLTDVAFVTIDPPGAKDLDQALHLARSGDGYVVQYAIADVAAFVRPGGAIDLEAHRRGQTFYGPDVRVSLHPPELSEGAASLLPGEVRPALVWQLDLDAAGELVDVSLRRAAVRSREQLTYAEVQADIDGGRAGDMLALLPEIGALREERERDRGGVSLPIPEQDIVADDGGYRLEFRSPLPVEGWNAQISLLTGMAAARLMRGAGVGVMRTLPAADPRDLTRLRRAAKALRVPWPGDVEYAALIPTLDPARPNHAAFLDASTVVLRGAGYAAFDGSVPDDVAHAAIAAEYAHVTAPLRRLVDRYGLEVCAAASGGTDVPGWAREALPDLPGEMSESDRRAGAYEGACLNLMEAAVLDGRKGETFSGVVVDIRDNGIGEIVLGEPAVQGRVVGQNLPLGEEITVRLAEVSVERREVTFELG